MTARAVLPNRRHAEREYSPNLDAYLSWCEAIAELRKEGIRAGRYQPQNEEERQLQSEGVRT